MMYGYGNGPTPRRRAPNDRGPEQPTAAPNTFAGMQRAGYARPARPPRPEVAPAPDGPPRRAPMPGSAEFVGGGQQTVSRFAPPPAPDTLEMRPGGVQWSNANASAPAPRVFSTKDGQVSEEDFNKTPAGTTGYRSAPLNASGTATSDGDASNPFRGYVSADGGRFGAGPAKDRAEALSYLEGISGVQADKFGFTGQESAADIDAIRKTMAGIANGDRASIEAGLSHANPFVKRTAQAYDLGYGSQGLGDVDYATEKARQKLGAGGGLGNGSGPAVGSEAYNQVAADNAGMSLGDYLQRMLNQSPTGYDDAALKSEFDRLAGSIDDEYAQRNAALEDEMARRGLSDSAGKGLMTGRLSDLNIGKRAAKVDLADRLATKRAESLNSGRQSWFDRLNNFGQQAFDNDYRTASFNADVQNAQDRILLALLGGK